MDSKTLKLINQIELQYGTITKCPEDDPRLLTVRDTLNLDDIQNETWLEKLTIDLANRGYTISEIARRARVSPHRIRPILDRLEIKLKPRFSSLASKGSYRIYASDRLELAKALGYSKVYDLKKAGWSARVVNPRIARWENIPDGDYYLAENGLIYVKRGLESYRKNRIYNLLE